MASLLRTGLAGVAVLLMLVALVLMTQGELLVAGVCFLTASFAIYVRETRAQ